MDNSNPTQALRKTFKKKMPILWWAKRSSHLQFILRELTSLAVAYFSIIFLYLLRSISQGEESYLEFISQLKTPSMMILNTIALIGLIYHSISWFSLAPKAMVIKLGKQRIPGILITSSNYIGWIVVSFIIYWFLK